MKIVRSRRALVAVFLALALPFTLAACGSDDTDGGEAAAQEEETNEQETPAESSGEDAGTETLHVTAEEYTFEGIPETLAAGEYSFHFENVGKEPHELALFKLNTDVPIEELVKLPQKKAMKQIEVLGGTFAEPGEVAEKPLVAELESGARYGAVCFIPTKKNGPPHAFQGMVHEFTVE